MPDILKCNTSDVFSFIYAPEGFVSSIQATGFSPDSKLGME